MELLPRVSRGRRRFQDRTTPQTGTRLSLRHVAAFEQLREGPLTVGALAAWLDLMVPTVSGVLADRAGLIIRQADARDRRRTVVQIMPGKVTEIRERHDDAAAPLTRVPDRLDPRQADHVLKAIDMLGAERWSAVTHAGYIQFYAFSASLYIPGGRRRVWSKTDGGC
jgi:DNA-binding MarR family transcriptional regulator